MRGLLENVVIVVLVYLVFAVIIGWDGLSVLAGAVIGLAICEAVWFLLARTGRRS